jgi:hypothetical protein
MINYRIEKEFPGEFSNKYCLVGLGWPCIELTTSGSYGPHYQEARSIVEREFAVEQEAERVIRAANEAADAANRAIDEHNKRVLQQYRDQFSPGAGAGSYAKPPDYIAR